MTNLAITKNLIKPLAYLSIKHKQKQFIDWKLPCASALIFTIFAHFMIASTGAEAKANLGETLVADVLTFTQSLPGFYIAALAAIATFNKPGMDQKMPEPAPTLDIKKNGKTITIEMTRRRFLCLMFAFLTAESILLCTILIIGKFSYIPVKSILPENLHTTTIIAYMALTSFVFFQMIITTLWGLFYLGYKLHQPED